ncbi:MAG: STM4015 family protein [Chloroflexota bacterium]
MFNHHLTQFIGRPVRPYLPDQGITHPEDVYRISIDYDEANWAHKFAQFVDDPQAHLAKGVVIGAWMGEDISLSSADTVAQVVATAPKLPNLHAIFLGDMTFEEIEISWIIQSDVSPLFTAFPALTHFGVRGGDQLHLGRIDHQNLTTLIIETGGLNSQVVTNLLASTLPALTHLELYIGTDDYGRTVEVEHLTPLLSQSLFPNLRYLGLRDADNADDIATAIAKAPILGQLDTLDLSLGTLSDDGGKALLASAGIKQLQKLDLHYHYLSDDLMTQFASQSFSVDVSDQQKDDDGWRYVAVGE